MIPLLPDRSRKEAVLATWIAFCLALLLAVPRPLNPVQIALDALVGAAVIIAGFWAASRVRPLAGRPPRQRATFAALSLLAGASLGGLLLAILIALARIEPALRSRFADRLSEPAWRPWALAFESSILEEVAFRLFAMSIAAWIVSRVVKRPAVVFVVAVAVSALLFGLVHVPAWIAAGRTPPLLIASVILLNGLAGVLLSWIFWRWGLVYAILCHFAGDMIVQSLGPKLVG